MKRIILLSFVLSMIIHVKTTAQTKSDSAQIIDVMLNYALGWYEGKPDSMEKAVYTDFGKRKIYKDENGKTKISPNTAMSLYVKTRKRSSKPMSHEDAVKKIKEKKVLSIYGDIATGYIKSDGWIDYILFARIDGEWKMMNVVWQRP